MKNRAIGLLAVLFSGCLLYIGYHQPIDLLDILSQIGQANSLSVSGFANRISSFLGTAMCVALLLVGAFFFVIGFVIKNITKIVMYVALAIATPIAFYVHFAIEYKLHKYGYRTCPELSVFTSRYTEETYVLPPMTCKQLLAERHQK